MMIFPPAEERAPTNQRASSPPPPGAVDQSERDPTFSSLSSSVVCVDGSAEERKKREREWRERFQKPEHSIRLMGPQIRMFSFLSKRENRLARSMRVFFFLSFSSIWLSWPICSSISLTVERRPRRGKVTNGFSLSSQISNRNFFLSLKYQQQKTF